MSAATGSCDENPPSLTPIVFCGGGTFLFWWELGVLHHSSIERENAYFLGVSTGNLVNTIYVCDIPLDRLIGVSERVFKSCRSVANVVATTHRWLDVILPTNAHALCTGRVFVARYRFPNTSEIVSQFNTREELIQTLIESISIPGYICKNHRVPMDHCFNEIVLAHPHPIVALEPRTHVNTMLSIPTTEYALVMYYDGKSHAKRLRLASRVAYERYCPPRTNLFSARSRWSSFHLIASSVVRQTMLGMAVAIVRFYVGRRSAFTPPPGVTRSLTAVQIIAWIVYEYERRRQGEDRGEAGGGRPPLVSRSTLYNYLGIQTVQLLLSTMHHVLMVDVPSVDVRVRPCYWTTLLRCAWHWLSTVLFTLCARYNPMCGGLFCSTRLVYNGYVVLRWGLEWWWRYHHGRRSLPHAQRQRLRSLRGHALIAVTCGHMLAVALDTSAGVDLPTGTAPLKSYTYDRGTISLGVNDVTIGRNPVYERLQLRGAYLYFIAANAYRVWRGRRRMD